MTHRDELDGVILVDEYGEGVDGDLDFERLVAVLLFESIDFCALHRAAHRAELGCSFDEGRRSGCGAFAFDLDFDVWVEGTESFGPKGHQIVESVGADGIEFSRYSGDGFVFGERSVDFDGLREEFRGQRAGNE